MRKFPRTALALAPVLLLACAHARPPEHAAIVKRSDCKELLRAADAARAEKDEELAAELAAACPQDKLAALIDASTPADGLLWCGRAAAAGQKGCYPARVAELAAQLHPPLRLGPSDEATALDPLLGGALDQVGKDLNLSWDAAQPDVIVGKLNVTLDHATSATSATVPDAKGGKVRVPATQHRFVARAEAQVELGGKTRMLRALEEARDTTWEAVAREAVPARFEPNVPAPEELKRRAALAWLRALSKALAASPPEGVEVRDERTCVAYGLSLNLSSGDAGTAARGAGEPAKVAACEKLLGEPAGAGIPVP